MLSEGSYPVVLAHCWTKVFSRWFAIVSCFLCVSLCLQADPPWQTKQSAEQLSSTPASTKRSANAGTMLAHRLRRWPNIVPTLAGRLVFAGTSVSVQLITFTRTPEDAVRLFVYIHWSLPLWIMWIGQSTWVLSFSPGSCLLWSLNVGVCVGRFNLPQNTRHRSNVGLI